MVRLVQQVRLDHDDRPNLSRFAASVRIQVGRPELPAPRGPLRHLRGPHRPADRALAPSRGSRIALAPRPPGIAGEAPLEKRIPPVVSERRITSVLDRALS